MNTSSKDPHAGSGHEGAGDERRGHTSTDPDPAGNRSPGSGSGDKDFSRFERVTTTHPQPGILTESAPPDPTPPETPTRRLRRLIRLQVYYGFFATLHWMLLYFFLIDEMGLPVPFVLMFAMFLYTVAALVMMALPAMEYRWALRTGFAMRVVAVLPFWVWPTPEGVFVGGFFFGLAQALFWVPYNLIFFEHRMRSVNAGTSAIAWAVQPFLDVVAAIAAGLLVMNFGFTGLFAAAFILGLVGWPGTLRLHPRSPVRLEIWDRLQRLKRLRLLMFLDGVSQGMIWIGVAIVTIVFIETASAYAAFFAVLGLVGAVAALVLGRMSDRRAKRFGFIWPIALVFGVANIVSAFAASLTLWVLSRGFSTFFGLVFDPFKNAVLLDVADTVDDLYMVRELLLNMGRVVGIAVLLVFYVFGSLQLALIVPGLIAILVPVLIAAGNLYPEERFVLKPWRLAWRQ